MTPNVRTLLALGVTAQQVSDLARGVVGDLPEPLTHTDRIRRARKVRLLTWPLVDQAVLAALAAGASWEEVATGLGGTPEEAERTYGHTWALWQSGDLDDDPHDFGEHSVGLHGDNTPEDTAIMLDQWYARTSNPWELGESDQAPTPATRVLVDGQGPAGDRQGVEQ